MREDSVYTYRVGASGRIVTTDNASFKPALSRHVSVDGIVHVVVEVYWTGPLKASVLLRPKGDS
jgi:hypothetical protein